MLADHPRSRPTPVAVSPRTGSGTPALRLVFCISRSRGRADSILVDLMDDGIASSDIAVLFLDPDRSVEAPAAGVAVPASSGAIRGVIASLAGARRVVMPAVGPVVVSGALSASSGVETAAGLPVVLQRFGVPQPEALRLAARVAEGHFFIAVQTPYSGLSDRACDIFIANKAEEVCTKIDVIRSDREAIAGAASRREAHP